MSPPGCEGEACQKYSAARLLRVGSYAEDNPNPRASHHFFDPTRHGAEQGLDNSSPWRLGLDVLLSEFITPLRGGDAWRAFSGVITSPLSLLGVNVGNFDLDGQPATERALGAEEASEDFPKNLFSAAHAERFLYRSLTAPTKLERRHYLALHVLAVGHVAHLLEDMGNPAHTRNDFVVDHLYNRNYDLEDEAKNPGAGRIIDELADGRSIGGSPPAAFANDPAIAQLVASKGQPLALHYVSALPIQDTTGFDLRDFWQTTMRDDGSIPSGFGLADLSNSAFFSSGSVSDRYPSPGRPGCPRDPAAPLDAAPVGGVVRALLPEREGIPSEALAERPIGPDTPLGVFYSSPLVPHLARCGFHELPRDGATVLTLPDLPFKMVIDESVQRDYLEILLPLTVDYTAKFLQHYFQQRIEVVSEGNNRFRLRNLMRLPFAANARDLLVVYDDHEGVRQTIPTTIVNADELDNPNNAGLVACDGSEIELGPDSGDPEDTSGLSSVLCAMPRRLAAQNPSGDPAGRFWVVLRGHLGGRGEVVGPDGHETDWKTKDYVTVFARSGGGLLVSGIDRPTPGLEVPGPVRDGLEQGDLFWLTVDDPDVWTEPADGDPPRAPVQASPLNLTKHLRRKPEDDFKRFSASSGVGTIAIASDRWISLEEQYYADIDGLSDGVGRYEDAALLTPSFAPGKSRIARVGGVSPGLADPPIWVVGTNSFLWLRTNAIQPNRDDEEYLGLDEYDAGSRQILRDVPILTEFPVIGRTADAMQRDPNLPPPTQYDPREHPEVGCGTGYGSLVGAKQDPEPLLGRLMAFRVSCYQMRPSLIIQNGVPVEGPEVPSRVLNHFAQIVLFDGSGQPTDAILTDGNLERAPELRSCAQGCDFEGFSPPTVSPVDFSPSETKLAFTVRPGVDQGPDLEGLPDEERDALLLQNLCVTSPKAESEIVIYDYAARALSTIRIPLRCVSRPSWLPDGKQLVFVARDSAASCDGPACQWTAYAIRADGSEATPRPILKPKGFLAVTGMRWFSPLSVPSAR